MAVIGAAIPLLPGKSEEWRRWVQELQGSRHADYVASCDRLGVLHARYWIGEVCGGDVVFAYLEVKDPAALRERLEASQDPFDVWYRQKLRALHGLEVAQLRRRNLDQVFVWPDRS